MIINNLSFISPSQTSSPKKEVLPSVDNDIVSIGRSLNSGASPDEMVTYNKLQSLVGQSDTAIPESFSDTVGELMDLQHAMQTEEVSAAANGITGKNIKEKIKEKIKALLAKGPVNSDDCENVRKFDDLLKSGRVKPGDIILLGEPLNPLLSVFTKLVPGDFSHVAVYLGTDEKGEHKSIDAFFPESQVRDAGWCPRHWNKYAVVTVNHPDGTELSDEERSKITDFAWSTEDCDYNFNWVQNKVELPVDSDHSKFYCSQLAWASYFHTTGINIDKNPGFSPKYASGVAPQEIYDSPYTKVIATSGSAE